MTNELRRAYRFFRRQGCPAGAALELARAERAGWEAGLSFDWCPDEGADLSWLRPGETVEEALCCLARGADGNVVAALGGVCDPDRDAMRLIEADLALEALEAVHSAGRARR